MAYPFESLVSHADTPDGPLVPSAHVKRLHDHVVNANRTFFAAHPGVTTREHRYIPGDVDRCTAVRLWNTRQARSYHRRTDEGDA